MRERERTLGKRPERRQKQVGKALLLPRHLEVAGELKDPLGAIRVVAWSEMERAIRELDGGLRCAAPRRRGRGGRDPGCQAGVRSRGGEREVPRAELAVPDSRCEPPV